MRRRAGRSDDRGSVAVEMALILPIFLLLVYGGLSFGLAMSAKGVITEAAAEGARAAVGAPAGGAGQCEGWTQAAANQAVNALKPLVGQSAVVGTSTTNALTTVTTFGYPSASPPWVATITATATSAASGSACVDPPSTGIQVSVAILYPYAARPQIASLPGIGAVLPTNLGATYVVGVS